MTYLGRVVSVETDRVLAFATADAAASATSLTVQDTSNLPATGTGSIGDDEYAYTVTSATTLDVSPALVADVSEGDALDPGIPGMKWATVTRHTGQGDDEVCRVPFGLRAYTELEDGIREPDQGETVVVDRDDVGPFVADVPVEQPALDGIAITPGTITETQIADDAISTPKLRADAIDGMTITGATVQTAASGQRVVLDENGVVLWTTAPVQTQAWSTVGRAFGIALDSSGNVYVTDMSNELVRKYAAPASEAASWSVGGSPRGLAVDSSGNVYVADWTNSLLRKFDASGTQIASWSTTGKATAVALDPAGNVYVCDSDNDRVRKYTSAGSPVTSWALSGGSSSIAVDGSNVYVGDVDNYQISKYDLAGTLITTWAVPATALMWITLDPTTSTLLVYSSDDSTARRFDASGSLVESLVLGSGYDGNARLVVADDAGDLLIARYDSSVRKYNTSGDTIKAIAMDAGSRELQALNGTFDGTLLASEIIADSIKTTGDTQWTAFNSSNFANYNNDWRNAPQWRIRAGVLWIRGVISPATGAVATAVSSASPGSNNILGTLPTSAVSLLRLGDALAYMQRGAGNDDWSLRIAANGDVHCTRYSGTATTTSYMPVVASLPVA